MMNSHRCYAEKANLVEEGNEILVRYILNTSTLNTLTNTSCKCNV